MLLIDEKDRDAISQALTNTIVPAQTGASLMNIVAFLAQLKVQTPDASPVVEVVPAPDAAPSV